MGFLFLSPSLNSKDPLLRSSNDISLQELTIVFVVEYHEYLSTVENLKHNVVLKQMQQLKHIVNVALRYEWIKRDSFINYSMTKEQVQKEFLLPEELKRWENVFLKNVISL
jgi:hypothetical protein